MGKKRIYEICVPVKETWRFEVVASSKREALELHNQGESEQTCSTGGWPITKKAGRSNETAITQVAVIRELK